MITIETLILYRRLEVPMKFYRHLFAICTILIFITAILFPPGAEGISVKEEEELSREFLKVIFSQFQLIKDPIIVDYVNDVGQKVVSVLPPQPFSYHFYVIKEDSYNAFATPAGHIFVNSGLIEAMENEEELAGVIAHEISHVSLRHISKKIERSKKINMVALAGVVAGVLLGSGGAAEAASAVTVGTLAAGQSVALAYSRDDESEADQVGLEYLNRAGYSSQGLLAVLEKMRSRRWFGSEQIPTYLQTHPASEARMVYIDMWLAKHEKVHANINPYPFERAHTWLVAAYGDENAALKQFESDVKNHPENPMAHYGYGLILAKTGNRESAIDHLRAALEKNAFDIYIIRDLGRVYFLDGRYQEALNLLRSAESLAPNNPQRLFYLGRTQIETGRLEEATVTFEQLISIYPRYSRAYYFLGETNGKLGRLNYAHYYLGIYYKLGSNFKNAAFHLKKALETMDDPEKRAEIEKMLIGIRKNKKQSRQQ
jgi:predicted Zn-dependent protease